jgi:hypothetical protein
MSCRTTPYTLFAPTTLTDIGPASGGTLHSITLTGQGVDVGLQVKIAGTQILALHGPSGTVQWFWKGLKIDGQLQVQVSSDSAWVTIEMSD